MGYNGIILNISTKTVKLVGGIFATPVKNMLVNWGSSSYLLNEKQCLKPQTSTNQNRTRHWAEKNQGCRKGRLNFRNKGGIVNPKRNKLALNVEHTSLEVWCSSFWSRQVQRCFTFIPSWNNDLLNHGRSVEVWPHECEIHQMGMINPLLDQRHLISS